LEVITYCVIRDWRRGRKINGRRKFSDTHNGRRRRRKIWKWFRRWWKWWK
jgi:hypothetical protein